MSQRDLVVRLARFAGELRNHGVPVSLKDEIDATEALTLVDLFDAEEVSLALRAALKVERRHWRIFEALFQRLWRRALAPGPPTDDGQRAPRPWPSGQETALELRRALAESAARPAGDEPGDEPTPEPRHPGYSDRALLRRKSFEECTDDDLSRMERLLDRMAREIATRRSRRTVPSHKGRLVDLRRSFRRAVATGGEPLLLARKERALELPDLVLLCDTSGSMDPHSRFLLTFVLSLKRMAGRTEAFAFNTRLTRLTPWISPGNVLATLERLAREVADWSGGTRIGACLLDFADRYASSMVSSDTTVVILSDGLDRGDVEMLETALAVIRRRARRVIWLNPLLGDERYRPEARGMKAALPFVDALVPAHNLESLEKLLPLLAA